MSTQVANIQGPEGENLQVFYKEDWVSVDPIGPTHTETEWGFVIEEIQNEKGETIESDYLKEFIYSELIENPELWN